MKIQFAAACYLIAVAAMAADFTVSNVRIRQRWPWEKKVDIDFDLVSASGADIDLSCKFYDGDAELFVPSSAISGNLYGVNTGAKRLVLDLSGTVYSNDTFLAFRAEITPSETPLYMVVDLNKSPGAEDQIAYVTKSDLDAGLYGACVTNPVSGVASLVWTDVTNDVYKSEKLVFRRINPGSFKTGGCGYRFSGSNWLLPSAYPATNTITLSLPYYIGVFPLTQAQAAKMGGGNVSRNKADPKLPTEYRTYDALRGAVTDNPSINWPATCYQVSAGSQMKKYRDALGFDVDIPTDAQWEYACRAGTTTLWTDNISRTFDTILASAGTVAIGQAVTDFNNDVVAYGWFSTNVTAIVGLFKPNAWGLYDMHGDVLEWCLDWAPVGRTSGTLSGQVYDTSLQMFRVDAANYAGCASGTSRVLHGGNYSTTAVYSTPAYRYWYGPATQNGNIGYRLVCFPNGMTPIVGDVTPDI